MVDDVITEFFTIITSCQFEISIEQKSYHALNFLCHARAARPSGDCFFKKKSEEEHLSYHRSNFFEASGMEQTSKPA